jgi:hypothetical protein
MGGHLDGKFPQKKSGFDLLGLGKIPDLLRKRARVPVRETFTGMLCVSAYPKLRATSAG